MRRSGAGGPLVCAALIGALGCWSRTSLDEGFDTSPSSPAGSGGAGSSAAGAGSSAAGTGGPAAGGQGGGGFAGSGDRSPEVIAPAAPGCGSIELATGGGFLAWTDREHGQVWITKPGRRPTLVSGAEKAPSLIVVDQYGAVSWSSLEGIRRAPLGGGAFTIAQGATDVRGLAVTPEGRYVYYSAGASIWSTRGIGNRPTEIAHHEHRGVPTAIALDDERLVYVTDVTGEVYAVDMADGIVARCGLYNPMTEEISGLNCLLVGQQGSLFSRQIVSRPGQAIWGNGASVALGDTTRVSHESITSVSSSISALAANATKVFFLAGNQPSAADYGVVYEAPVALRQTALPIATGQDHPGSIAVDDARVYWSTGACEILSLSI